MKDPIGFIGMGNMGMGMARNILKAGFPLIGYDVRVEPLRAMEGMGGQRANCPRAVSERARITFVVVLNYPQIEQAILGEQGLQEGAKPGDMIVLMSTISPFQVKDLAQKLGNRGVQILDAPISGGKEGAEAGTLSIMVGGEEKVFEACRPILSVLGKNFFYMGGIGSGHAVKAINNFLSATTLAATSEAVILASKLGLSPQRVIEVLQVSTGRSYSTELKFPKFVLPRTFNSGFTIDLMYKDIETVTRMAREYKIPMFLANMVQQIFGCAMIQVGEKGDHTAIFAYLEDWAKGKKGD